MKKRILSLFCSLCILAAAMSAGAADQPAVKTADPAVVVAPGQPVDKAPGSATAVEKLAKADTASCEAQAQVIVSAARIRDSKKNEVIGYLAKGDVVFVTGNVSKGWLPIRDLKGRKGKVVHWALKTTAGANVTKSKATATEVVAAAPVSTVTAGESLAIRITSLRLEVLELKRTAEETQKDVKEIKAFLKDSAKK